MALDTAALIIYKSRSIFMMIKNLSNENHMIEMSCQILRDFNPEKKCNQKIALCNLKVTNRRFVLSYRSILSPFFPIREAHTFLIFSLSRSLTRSVYYFPNTERKEKNLFQTE